MTDAESKRRTSLSEDMIFGLKRRERLAYGLAFLGSVIGLLGVGTTLALLPLKESQAFLAIVDKDTGIAERVVEVEAAGMSDAAAVQQALLFNYVSDRETFDEHDNEARILSVYRRSAEDARASLVALWDEGNESYPPAIYGGGARATVRVLAINPITDTTAQVRFEKTLTRPNGTVQTGKFSATVAWAFQPKAEKTMKLIWENPLGFTVTAYRVSSETITPEG